MTEEELLKELGKLERGDKITLNINGTEVTYINPPEPAPVCEQHYYEDAGHGEGKCRDCINGIVFDPSTHHIVEGKLVRL